MTLARTLFALALAFGSLTGSGLARSSEPTDHLAEMREADRVEFTRLSDATLNWNGDDTEMARIRDDLRRLSAKYPDSVPVKMQSSIAEWTDYSNGMGLVLGGRSYIPVFLEYQRMAPDYPRPYVMAARAYIHTSDFEGAKPSLQKASALAPNDPWPTLAWALWHSRQLDRQSAIEAAREAIPKSAGDAPAMADAILFIGNNYGIRDTQEAEALVQKIFETESNPAILTTVVRRTFDAYYYQAGLLEIAAGILQRLSEAGETSPDFTLELARLTLYSGGSAYYDGAHRYDPSVVKSTLSILDEISDEPTVLERVWGIQFGMALSENDFGEAERLIKEGEARGFTPRVIGYKQAMLYNAQNKPREVVEVYDRLGLRDDNLAAEARARTGGRDEAKMYYLRQIENNPTNPHLQGNFAGFLLYYFSDVEGGIQYATKANELMPYPMARMTLAMAYLAQSGQQLRSGNLNEALRTFDEAKQLGYDENYILQSCYNLCEPIRASLTAFR